MIKAGIVGVSGYGGVELFHILSNHPDVEITAISSRSYAGKKIGEVYPHLINYDITCKEYTPDEIAELCDVIFTAVPHGGPGMEFAAAGKKAGKKVIDLSADFRLKDLSIYEEWYKTKHMFPEFLNEAVYGLPELYREKIKKTWLIANPGCYTTSAILSLCPIIKEKIIDETSIIVDAKSGTSGAGRTLKQNLHFSELDASFQAYSIPKHRHCPEIEQEISNFSDNKIKITFTPHLVPMVRGILSVSYAKLIKKISQDDLVEIYKNIYKDEPFVRILTTHLPNTKFVSNTNYIDIAVKIDDRTDRVIIISAIDNLIKGASGQAVQNMNIMFGLNEKNGLNLKCAYP